MREKSEKPEKLEKPLPEKWEDPVLKIGVEFANSVDRWLTGPLTDTAGEKSLTSGYYIRGYAFVINADQAVYERSILLRPENGTEPVYRLATDRAYRPDIADNLQNQIHDQLTGFGTVIRRNALPSGRYQVGMLAKDRTSRQRLVNWSDVILVIR